MPVVERTYAQALFDAAREKKRVEVVREELGDFVAAVNDVPELRALLFNPQLDPRARVSALEGVLQDADELVRNFLLLVAERGRATALDDIFREFERLVAQEAGQLTVELTTAIEVSDEEAEQIVKQIEQASGRPVEATRHVDPELIGGVVLQVGSRRVDASVRGRLDRLRRQLTRAS